jgi:hypothetical protein
VAGGAAKVIQRSLKLELGLDDVGGTMLGLVIALLLWQAARGLRAPPGAGYD